MRCDRKRINENERYTTMKTTTKNTGIKVRTTILAGALNPNHVRAAIKIKAGLKAGALNPNHTRTGLRVKAGVKAGMIFNSNHSVRALTVA
jgi:hypothetical protein